MGGGGQNFTFKSDHFFPYEGNKKNPKQSGSLTTTTFYDFATYEVYAYIIYKYIDICI